MRPWLSIPLFCCLALAGAAMAEDTRLRTLDTMQDGRQWEAVGRLDIGGAGFCTGALISEQLVLTAAHCLFDSQSGARIDHTEIAFLAGWRNGRASAIREVRRAVIHPDYRFGAEVTPDRVRLDIALLELQMPIRNGTIRPFETGSSPRRGDRVGVVSYALDRSEAPSLQTVCEVLAQQSGMLVTSCDVDFGSSGAPIFGFDGDRARIVSVVSAKAHTDGERKVSLGTSLSAPLRDLRAALDAGRGYGVEPAPSTARVAIETARPDIGAKFVRP